MPDQEGNPTPAELVLASLTHAEQANKAIAPVVKHEDLFTRGPNGELFAAGVGLIAPAPPKP